MHAKHTPTPYKSDQGLNQDCTAQPIYCIWTNESTPHYIGEIPLKANAEFIVRACNAHQALINALQAMIDAHKDDPSVEGVTDQSLAHMLARSALKLAEAA